MDYLLPKGAKKYCNDVVIPVNIEERKARIPGTGDESIAMTMAEDIGKAVVWLINDPRPWPKYTYIAGSVNTWNELIKLGEEATGDKFAVEYVSEEELHRKHKEALATGDALKAFYAEVDIWYGLNGSMALPENEDTLLFSGIQFIRAKDLINQTYGK
jgi:nucleoside-diphosphate-sugar epimerase